MKTNNNTPTVTEFLRAFFPDENEKIHLRAFKAKELPAHIKAYAGSFQTTRCKLPNDTALHEELAEYNKNCGIYFVVNSGGNSDDEISRYNAFFTENDNLSIEEQHTALDNAPIQPSIRVKTKKSVHAYWLIDGDCSEEDWRDIQARLIQYFDGDKSIKNPSRCMRVPYFDHVSFDDDQRNIKRVEIASFDSDKRFTVQEMKEAFQKVADSNSQKSKNVTDVTDVTTLDQQFETWSELNGELGLRIIQKGKLNSSGKYEMKCPVHNGKSDTVLFFDPKTKAIKCMNECPHADLLKAFGLPTEPNSVKETKQSKDNQSALILKITKDIELFVNQENQPFACITVNGHKENWAIESKTFREWISRTFYVTYKKVPNEQSIKDALGTLAGKAKYEGEKKQVYYRRAEYNGAIYLDLANDNRQVVKITADGWEVTSDCPVRFRNTDGLKPLPIPERNGSLTELDKFLNVKKEDLPLVKAWLVTALRTNIPYPILIFSGHMNCGKTTATTILCELIDPNEGGLFNKPQNAEALYITANNRVIFPLDNLSFISEDLSDMLCRVSTGSSYLKRKNYTDIDETILKAKNPIIINGIGDIATREDFLSRCVILELPTLESRVDEISFWKDFYQSLPSIFGALLDAASESLRKVESVKLADTDLRMLDFAKIGTSVEESLGLSENVFIEIYRENYKNIRRLILDNNIVVTLLLRFMKDKPEWIGTATDLYEHLDGMTNYSNQKRFPKAPNGLSNALERLGKNLLAEGIDIEKSREGGTGSRIIKIINLHYSPSQPSQSSQDILDQQILNF
jgi:hypothetical protein